MHEQELQFQPFTVSFDAPLPDGNAPVPLILRRVREGEEPNIFASRRGYVRTTEAEAAKADRILAPTEEEKRSDRAFADANRFLRLAKEAKPFGDYLDALFTEGGEFFHEIDSLIDHCEGHETSLPDFVYEAEEDSLEFDPVEQLDEWLSDNMYEDAADDIVDRDSFRKFWAEWKAKQHIVSWHEVRRIRVIDQVAFDGLIAKAEAVVAAGRLNWFEEETHHG